MKFVNLAITISSPFIVMSLYRTGVSFWLITAIAGFLIGATKNTLDIKTSILSVLSFSFTLGILMPLFYPDSQSTFIRMFAVFFCYGIIFSALGYVLGLLVKNTHNSLKK